MSDTDQPVTSPAGWYTDGEGRQRYWDGHAWGPEAPAEPATPELVQQPRNPQAMTGFVWGVLAVAACWIPIVNLILPILGIAYSSVALYRVNKLGAGRLPLAAAGLILSCVAAFIFFLAFLISIQS